MESLPAIFLSSFAVAFSGALMPGPLLSTTISESGKYGWRVGPLYILGHGILEIVLIAGLFLGLAPLLTGNTAFVIIAFAGGSFMIWMAWGMFRSIPNLSIRSKAPQNREPESDVEDNRRENKGNLVLTGILMSLANPYWIIWWATIGLGYVLSSGLAGPAGVVVFFTGHILADLLWYAFVSYAVDKGRNVLPDRVYKTLIAICGVFLAAYALYLIVNGVLRLS